MYASTKMCTNRHCTPHYEYDMLYTIRQVNFTNVLCIVNNS